MSSVTPRYSTSPADRVLLQHIAAAIARMPGVPWRSVIGMRNRLVHVYFDVDRDILWRTVAFALPPLLAEVRAVLDTEADAKGR